jgi:LmbE family N-acetylglucosaminyl deacetylase
MMLNLYISPHLDDAVFSCGGLIATQEARGESVSVLTIFAGDPPDSEISQFAAELHARWGEAGPPIANRRAEDRVACGRVGASVHHLYHPEAVYRRGRDGRFLYPDDRSIFGELQPEDTDLVDQIVDSLHIAHLTAANIYCPIGAGGHVDHRLARMAVERSVSRAFYYYEFPYSVRDEYQAEVGPVPNSVDETVPLAPEAIDAWTFAAAEYRTQISTFWKDEEALFEELREFHDASGGIRLRVPQGISQEVEKH